MSLFLSLYQTDKFYVELWGYVVFFFVCFLLFFYGPNTVSCWSSPVVFCINLIWRVERKKMDQLFSVLPLNGSKVRKKVYSELFCWQISNHFAGALVSLFIWSHVGLLLTNITSNMSPLKEFVPMEGLLGKMPSQHLTVLSFYFFIFLFFFLKQFQSCIFGVNLHMSNIDGVLLVLCEEWRTNLNAAMWHQECGSCICYAISDEKAQVHSGNFI